MSFEPTVYDILHRPYSDAFTTVSSAYLERMEKQYGSVADTSEEEPHTPTPPCIPTENDALQRALQRERDTFMGVLATRIQASQRQSTRDRYAHVSSTNGDIALDACTIVQAPPATPRTIALRIQANKHAYSMDVVDAATGASVENVSNVVVQIVMKAGRPYATATITLEQPQLDLDLDARGTIADGITVVLAQSQSSTLDAYDTQDMSAYMYTP